MCERGWERKCACEKKKKKSSVNSTVNLKRCLIKSFHSIFKKWTPIIQSTYICHFSHTHYCFTFPDYWLLREFDILKKKKEFLKMTNYKPKWFISYVLLTFVCHLHWLKLLFCKLFPLFLYMSILTLVFFVIVLGVMYMIPEMGVKVNEKSILSTFSVNQN